MINPKVEKELLAMTNLQNFNVGADKVHNMIRFVFGGTRRISFTDTQFRVSYPLQKSYTPCARADPRPCHRRH